jgi:hypothetical protein
VVKNIQTGESKEYLTITEAKNYKDKKNIKKDKKNIKKIQKKNI